MEAYFEIKFTSYEEDVNFWSELAEGLCDHKRGAWLEERFDRFGTEATALVTEIMDECDKSNAGDEAIIFETWEREGNQFQIVANGGWIVFDLLPKIRALLHLCNVQNLVLDDPEEEY